MFQIEIAGLAVRIENRFAHVREQCAGYIISSKIPADISVSVSEEELRRETAKAPDSFPDDGYAESVIAYEKISNALPAFDAFVMHSSAMAVDGWGYAIAAESGTGKTTQTRFWKDTLGERMTVINGDKPVYRFRDGKLMVYGTPWCGKEKWQTNASVPMKAVCLLERGEENAVFPSAMVQAGGFSPFARYGADHAFPVGETRLKQEKTVHAAKIPKGRYPVFWKEDKTCVQGSS